jgi:hypothetical protein
MNFCPDHFAARKPPAEVDLPQGRTTRSSTLSSLASLIGTSEREQASSTSGSGECLSL